MLQELHYRIALTFIPQIGDVVAKGLLEQFGTASAIFTARQRDLERTPGVGTLRAAAIRHFSDFRRVEEEISFLERQQIKPVFYTDAGYPKRLQHCYASPVMLYTKGAVDLLAPRVLAIVGTRRPTAYGHDICEKIVEELAGEAVTIVSGMAYGIDIVAHRAALKHSLPTIGVLAHGLDRLYPSIHAATAQAMQQQGGLLTDFRSGTQPDRQNFPRRNRIVAGLCDATLVIESGLKGGSLITADIASGYNRDVLAVPGRIGDDHSAGCLELIRQNKAALVTSAADVLEALNWRPMAGTVTQTLQQQLFPDLEPEAQQVVSILQEHDALHIDDIRHHSGLPQRKLPGILLQLEMLAVLRALPGNTYQLINR